MGLRPLVLRAHFYHPALKPKHNFRSPLGHFKYMGNPKKEELARAGERGDTRENAAIHAAYIAGRPGSTGYIGPDPDSLPDPDAIAKELRDHQGPVWRMFVSVREDDARRLGLMDRPLWEQAARTVVPEMAQRMGIPAANLRWVAAMHRKKGHPHLHLLVWEHTPKRDRGMLADKERQTIRRAWVRELYRPVREPLAKEMAAALKLVEQASRTELTQVVTAWRIAAAKKQFDTAPRLTKSQAEELTARLEKIKDGLPGKGRVALAYMPPEVKQAVRDTVDWLINAVPEYRDALERHVAGAREMASHYSDSGQSADQAADNARERVADKLGQGVLRAAVALDHATKRDDILRIATGATKGGRPVTGMPLPELPTELTDRANAEIRRISRMPPQEQREAAYALARELLTNPAAAAATRNYRQHIAREALSRALPAKWLEQRMPETALRLPDSYADLAQAVAKDAAARTVESDGRKEWLRQINAIHQAPPDKRRESADRAAAWLLKQPEAKTALAELLKNVPRAERKAAYQQARAQLARGVDHHVRRLAALWTREKVAQGMDALTRHVARSITWAAQYAAFQRTNFAVRTVMALWQGLMLGLLRTAREEELAAERLAAEEAAARAKRRQMEAAMMR